jgi:hypothetical protein
MIAMGIPDINDEIISHSLLPSGPPVFTPSCQSHAHGLKKSGHQCTGEESHRKQKDKAHIHDALLSTINKGNCLLQSIPFAKETGPLVIEGTVCLSGRRRAEFGVT